MDKYKNSYILLEMTYIDIFKSNNIFPINWYYITNYKIKIEILNEAIKKNILITDTEKYKDLKL